MAKSKFQKGLDIASGVVNVAAPIADTLLDMWGMNKEAEALKYGSDLQRQTALDTIKEAAKKRRADYRMFLEQLDLDKGKLDEQMRQFDKTFGLSEKEFGLKERQVAILESEESRKADQLKRARQAGLSFAKSLMQRQSARGTQGTNTQVFTSLAGGK